MRCPGSCSRPGRCLVTEGDAALDLQVVNVATLPRLSGPRMRCQCALGI